MPKGNPAGYLPPVTGTTKPKNGKKKRVPMKGDMGGMLGKTSKKPEPDLNIRKKQSAARVARLSGKLI